MPVLSDKQVELAQIRYEAAQRRVLAVLRLLHQKEKDKKLHANGTLAKEHQY